MSNIITEKTLKKAITDKTFIIGGRPENAEGVKYDFRMGPWILKTEFGQPINVNEEKNIEKKKLVIDPGEVVFVLTEETLNLPSNISAVLSPKRKLSHAGIIPLGGFCIDPLYHGRLLVGLYNLSSTPFPLMPGRKMIAAVFYQLEEVEIDTFCTPDECIEEFPPDLIRMMQNYRPISTQSLIEKICHLEEKIEHINRIHEKREEWFERFENGLDRTEKSVQGISQALKEEKESRRDSDKVLEKRFTEAYDKVNDTILKITRENLKTAATVGAIGAILITIFVLVLKQLLFTQ